jgi:hypothetical protein
MPVNNNVISNTLLISFKAISDFVNDLFLCFETIKPLELYHHLISKTLISHEVAIQKHFDAFQKFCLENRDGICSLDFDLLVETKISYSDKVFIDLKEIFAVADTDTKNAIWKHILNITSIVDPSSKARQILKDTVGKESDFLSDVIGKIEKNVDPNANPMEAISSIMQSGIFTDLITGMGAGLQNGTLDLPKMMSTVQTMVNKISQDNSDENGASPPLDLNSMLSAIMPKAGTDISQTGEKPIDFMSMLGPILQNLTIPQSKDQDFSKAP